MRGHRGEPKCRAGWRTAFWGLALAPALALALALAWGAIAGGSAQAQTSANAQTSGADGNTVALWLFDDPSYLNVTLTDAGERHYDLRLYTAGMLGPGRFGGAVGRDAHKSGQAVSFAETPQHFANDWQGTLKSRPATPPGRLLEALQEGDWTWEFHVKPIALPAEEACVVDAGRQAFYCALAERGERLLVRSAPARFDLAVPLDKRLTPGAWHHVALTWSRARAKLACFVDGAPCGAAASIPPVVRTWPNTVEGLRGRIFADARMTRAAGDEITPTLDCRWGGGRGVDWSERWVGLITFPVTGEVRFRVEASGGVRLKIGQSTVLDGGDKKGPTTGRLSVVAGKAYPLVVEYVHAGKDASLRLFWSFEGRPERIVPATAYSHAPAGPASYRFDVALLGDQHGNAPCPAWLDEMRVSRVVRYSAAFTAPGSFSRQSDSRQSGAPRPKAVESGALPLLFAEGAPSGPIALGSRKHVFIDDALIAQRRGVALRPSRVQKIERTDFRFPIGDASIVDDGAALRLYYGGWNDCNRLATSADGLKFHHADYRIAQWGDQTGVTGDAVLRLPGQASFFLDANPQTPPDERYKGIAWIMARGIYGLSSPDGIHWRRSETTLLPFDCGGGVEGYWDDQRGVYVCHIRHEGSYARTGDNQRLAARAEGREFAAPWPFQPDAQPVARRALTLPALWKELPTPFVPSEGGQVYRTRAVKYPWAPDVYLAFIWRYDVPRDLRATELAVSRDGRNWKFLGQNPAYIPAGVTFDGDRVARAALPALGLVRRGDALWQYAAFDTRGHNESQGYASLQRLAQRLDGFVALSADGDGGWAQTRSLVFRGRRLELNVAARGTVRVGLLDQHGAPIPGFAAADCRPIREDGVRVKVAWAGGDDVSRLAGQPVRLRFELNDAELYAFQFVP